jgi:ribosome-binding factor A
MACAFTFYRPMSERINQINELIKQELAKILLEDINFDEGTMVTVMDVNVSNNLETANVWISIFPEGKTGGTLEIIKKSIGKIQKALNRRTSMRFTPRISFRLDKSERYAAEIAQKLKEAQE